MKMVNFELGNVIAKYVLFKRVWMGFTDNRQICFLCFSVTVTLICWRPPLHYKRSNADQSLRSKLDVGSHVLRKASAKGLMKKYWVAGWAGVNWWYVISCRDLGWVVQFSATHRIKTLFICNRNCHSFDTIDKSGNSS